MLRSVMPHKKFAPQKALAKSDERDIFSVEVSRRNFLKKAAKAGGAVAVTAVVPESVLEFASGAKKNARYEYLDGYNPEKDKTLGNIRLARLLKNDKCMTLKRRDGSKIKVPYLRNNEDPNLVAESALALWAAYFTTGKQKPLNAFSSYPDVTSVLEQYREEMNVESGLRDVDGGPYSQLVIYDTPDDPATFSSYPDETGKRIIKLNGGTLFSRWQQGIDSYDYGAGWQNPDTHKKIGPLYYSELAFSFDDTTPGEAIIDGVKYTLLNTHGYT